MLLSAPGLEKIRVGISACLLGERVRYDAGHKLDRFLTQTLGRYIQWVPVCPEVEYGLPTPREPMRLVGEPEAPRLIAYPSGVDHNAGLRRWAEKRLAKLEGEGLCGFVFKSRSPSSGLRGIPVRTASGIRSGSGIFARALVERFPLLPVEDDLSIHDPGRRENFIVRIFAFRRWRDWPNKSSRGSLLRFHAENASLMWAHHPHLFRSLAELIRRRPAGALAAYGRTFLEGLCSMASVPKNVRVLRRLSAHLKKALSAGEDRELRQSIEEYGQGRAPLLVPLVLLRSFAREYDEPALRSQSYLNPEPLELLLRFHA